MKFNEKMLLLYAVTDRAWVGKQTLLEQIEDALKGGVTIVQLREKKLDHDSLKWFMGLSGAAIEFAEDLDLNLFMTVEDGPQGYIRFETSYFELDDRHGPLPMAFWSLLTEVADRTIITHCEELFTIELYFDLYRIGDET